MSLNWNNFWILRSPENLDYHEIHVKLLYFRDICVFLIIFMKNTRKFWKYNKNSRNFNQFWCVFDIFMGIRALCRPPPLMRNFYTLFSGIGYSGSSFLTFFSLTPNFIRVVSICFSILAYPTSGTPFVDHHSAFLSLLTIYVLIFYYLDT